MLEFKDKGANDIITFEAPYYDLYTQENWNAVALYNYVNLVVKETDVETLKDFEDINNPGAVRIVKPIVTDCKSKVLDYYLPRVSDKLRKIVRSRINKAFEDISKYVQDLYIDSFICANKSVYLDPQNKYNDLESSKQPQVLGLRIEQAQARELYHKETKKHIDDCSYEYQLNFVY